MNLILGKIKKIVKLLSPPQLIALGFAGVILLGALILMLPISVRETSNC